MAGCAKSSFLENVVKATLPNKETTTAWMEAKNNTRQRTAKFEELAARERCKIQNTFVDIKKEVDEMQRDALVAFDEKVNAIRKQLAVDFAAFQVSVNQQTAVVMGGFTSPHHEIVAVADPKPPAFEHLAFEYLRLVLSSLWSVTTPSESAEPVSLWWIKTETEETSKAKVEAEAIQSQVTQMSKVAEVVNKVCEAAKARFTAVYSAWLQRERLESWQGAQVAVFPHCVVSEDVMGLAVNDEALSFAVSDNVNHKISVYELPSGTLFARFGELGDKPGQFNTPLRMCFTPSGTLLVADSKNRRVQEMTVTGDCVTMITNGVFESSVMHVACNSEVVVVSQQKTAAMVCIFCMETRALLHFFSPGIGFACRDTVFSFDGRRLILSNIYERKIQKFSFDGTYLGSTTASLLNSVDSVAELPDGRLVVCESEKERLAICFQDCTNLEFVACAFTTSLVSQVRFSNGFVFVSNGDSVYVFK